MPFFIRSLVVLIFVVHSLPITAQLSPPGLDNTNTVLWTALGINQNIGTKWFNQSYIGFSRCSDPNNNALLSKQAIYVVEQQTYRKFGSHWQLGFCLSLRGQNMYSDDPPYESENPALRREIRYYLRLFYRHQYHRFSFAYSLRPEWRNFYNPDWSNYYSSPKALRYRIKGQVGFAVGQSKKGSIILANELLFVQQEQRQPTGDLTWSQLTWTEDRIATYYRYTLPKKRMVVDIGMMQQLNFKNGSFVSNFVHLAFDVLFIDPFGKRKNQ